MQLSETKYRSDRKGEKKKKITEIAGLEALPNKLVCHLYTTGFSNVRCSITGSCTEQGNFDACSKNDQDCKYEPQITSIYVKPSTVSSRQVNLLMFMINKT